MATALILGIIGVPALLMLILRINASLVFLSVCLGSVLLQIVGPDAVQLSALFSARAAATTPSTVQLVLLLLPVVLTMLFMIHSLPGKKTILNILPALGAGFLLLVLVEPLLSPGVQGTLTSSPWWSQLQRVQDLVVGVIALLSLMFLWRQRPKPEFDKKHK